MEWQEYVTGTVYQHPNGKWVFRKKKYKRQGQAVKAAWVRYCAITKGTVK